MTLHYRPEDLSLRRFFATMSVPEDDLRDCLAALSAKGKTPSALRKATGLPGRKVTAALNLLNLAGALHTDRNRVRLRGTPAVDDVLAAAEEVVAARQRIEQSRVEMMRGYAEADSCRRQYLLGYFGADHPGDCGTCDNCERTVPREVSHDVPVHAEVDDDEFRLQGAVVHDQWGEGTVMRIEEDRLTVFFPEQGYRTLVRSTVLDKGILRPLS